MHRVLRGNPYDAGSENTVVSPVEDILRAGQDSGEFATAFGPSGAFATGDANGNTDLWHLSGITLQAGRAGSVMAVAASSFLSRRHD